MCRKVILIIVLLLCPLTINASNPLKYGVPKGTYSSNDLIIRDCYCLSSNDETKFADWVA